jgi:pyridoxamine 5'-phosphate oxidase-like protein
MRRGLAASDLGDLFDQPLAAVLSIGLPDGGVFSRPIWHRFVDGRFVFQFPAGDRKIPMLERDPRATVVLAEDAYPYRAIEVRGRVNMRREGYHEVGAAICRPYVEAFDPNTDVSAYLSDEPGVIVELEADVTTCWDYADDAMMPPASGPG